VLRLLIIQDYIPAYRVPFFRQLRPSLAVKGIDLRLIAGRPQGPHEFRQDSGGEGLVDRWLQPRTFSIAGRTVSFRSLRQEFETFAPHGVVVQQALRNLELYQLFLERTRQNGSAIGMWGHGRTFSTHQGAGTTALKNWLTRRSDWFFSYTQEGARYLAEHGYDPSRISVLNNTICTHQLKTQLAEVRDAEVNAFRQAHGLTPGRTAIFIGGVDQAKGIEFLIETAREINHLMPDFKLIIGGSGSDAELVRRRQSAGDPISYLGRIDGREKALALKSADLMMVPEWVGLVAVDSLAAGKPIMTTFHPSHSSEFGYLQHGRTCLTSRHEPRSYAQDIFSLLTDRPRLTQMQNEALKAGTSLSMDAMVSRFVEGSVAWLNETTPPPKGGMRKVV
jgi:glycosyltransferase involved in cell wall biosynthesis